MKPRRIILAGGTGFLGQILSLHFADRGYEVVVLTRTPLPRNGSVAFVQWDGQSLGPWVKHLEGALAVINLAGRSVNCRYNMRNRRSMMDSRVASTRVLGEAIQRCKQPPRVWLNSSTATIYQHTFGPAWDESGEIGSHPEAKDAFSIQVAITWEREFEKAETSSTRKLALRSAMVLGLGRNSVFPVLRRLARLGLAGRMGSGRQFVSWVHENDFCRAVQWLIDRDDMEGIVNVAAPDPLPNAEMMRTLREVLGARFGLPATQWMLEAGAFLLRTETELIVKSRRVVPGRLLKEGFEFLFTDISASFDELHRRASRR